MNLKGKEKAVFIYAIAATVVAVALLVVLLVTLTGGKGSEKAVSAETATETAASESGAVTETGAADETGATTGEETETEAFTEAADTESSADAENETADETEAADDSYSALNETLKRTSEGKLSGKTVPREAFEALGVMQGAVLDGWSNMLDKLHLDADIVFFGDSLTKGSDFQSNFQDMTIVNLGIGGDTIDDLLYRVSMVGTVNPEKVFLLCGINSLRDGNVEECFWKYSELFDKLQETVPNATIYIQSVLPLSKEMQKGLPCSNETVKEFNEGIKWLASDRGVTYIDLYPLYELDGVMNPEYSSDGIHPIAGEGYQPWAEAVYPYIYE